MSLDDILTLSPYGLDSDAKGRMLDQRLHQLTRHHYNACSQYRRIVDALGIDIEHLPHYTELPFLPVRLFKERTLRSCPADQVVKTLTSSGTTGQQVSKIYLDRSATAYQTKCLTRIVGAFLGQERRPMLILDSSAVIKDRSMFSARGAGILGFSIFGSKRAYALNAEMELDIEGMERFLDEHRGKPLFLFGFTFMIWQHFYRRLVESGYRPDLSKATLIHGGGWKKLASENISSDQFKECLNQTTGILPGNIHDYYGMVEQTGTIYVECPCGHLHASTFSDVIIRDPADFSICPPGKKGLIQVVSVLPESYPGHSLLTEDMGVLFGNDDCPCGLRGKYFKIEGRIKNAEIRGCSDTYASKF